MKKVEIIRFNARHNINKGKKELEKLINEGWKIESMGGVEHDCVVILTKDEKGE